MAHKIMINCGHGKSTDGSWDPGCAYAGYTEAGLMLPITKAAVKYLRGCGIKVLSDADTGNDKNIIADVRWANAQDVELYVSVHCDYSKAPKGVMPLYVSTKGKKLATALNSAIKSGVGINSRGVIKRLDLWELNGTEMPAVVLETSAVHDKILREKPDAYGKAIAKGVCAYLGVKFVEPAKTKAVTVDYKVNTGNKSVAYYADHNANTKKGSCRGVFTIVEEYGQFGKLKSGAGWVKLSDVTRVPASSK